MKLGKDLKMEEAAILAVPAIVVNWYVRYAGAGWKREHVLQYHVYLTLVEYNLKDAVPFLYGCSPGHLDGLASVSAGGRDNDVDKYEKSITKWWRVEVSRKGHLSQPMNRAWQYTNGR